MAHKQVLFRSEAREKLLRGATALADAVRVTLGPKSKCVLIQRTFGIPLVCNDGVTIAREMDLKDAEREPGRPDDQRRPPSAPAMRSATAPARPPFWRMRSSLTGLRNVVAGASAIDIKRGLDRGSRSRFKASRRFPVRSRAAWKRPRSRRFPLTTIR